MGSLLENKIWKVGAPTGSGAEKYVTGAEIEIWKSKNNGASWKQRRRITRLSEFKQSPIRRALDAKAPFMFLRAVGKAKALSPLVFILGF